MPHPSFRTLPIRLRLGIGYALFLVVIIFGISAYSLASLEESTHREVDEALRLRASQITRQITTTDRQSLDPVAVVRVLSNLAPQDEFVAPGIYVQVLDHNTNTLAHSANLPGGELPVSSTLLDRALAGQEVYAEVPVWTERVRVFAEPVQNGEMVVGVVLVGESMHQLDATLGRTRQFLFLSGTSATVLSLFGSWWLTARALQPVAEVTRVARRIEGTGRFDQRLTSSPANDEVGELTATFNKMLDRLERTFQHQREFLADASHELRGPLMVIRGNLDLLKLELPKEERMESVRDAVEEVDNMTRLVADLLFLAESDTQATVEHLPVDLHDVVVGTLERAKDLDASSHRLVLIQNDPCVVRGDRRRLEQLLWNLVENGLRYTPGGGTVSVSLRRYEQIAELIVSDTGIGMSSEHLPRIFDRFYRVDRSRSRHLGGTGLGLAIVKQITEAHGGQARVRSEKAVGTSFTVVLPL